MLDKHGPVVGAKAGVMQEAVWEAFPFSQILGTYEIIMSVACCVVTVLADRTVYAVIFTFWYLYGNDIVHRLTLKTIRNVDCQYCAPPIINQAF